MVKPVLSRSTCHVVAMSANDSTLTSLAFLRNTHAQPT